MLSALSIYFKIAFALKTPFIWLMDSQYETISKAKLTELCCNMPDLSYIPETRDCDNFAFIYKGIADRTTNAVGIVVGKVAGGFHAWNVALGEDGIYQVEPQNGLIVHEGYRPLVVII